MKNYILIFVMALFVFSCGQQPATESATPEEAAVGGGQSNVKDDVSNPDVVRIAVNSPDHKTLVAALKAAEYVDALSNAGPFTVFAPTDAAFAKLPAGTVDGLMKDDKKADLQNILQYHVTVSAIKAENLMDGQTLGMVNGDNVTVSVKDGKVTLNGTANIVASVPASNGMIHIIDAVLLPTVVCSVLT